jgi:hypothetical protein
METTVDAMNIHLVCHKLGDCVCDLGLLHTHESNDKSERHGRRDVERNMLL